MTIQIQIPSIALTSTYFITSLTLNRFRVLLCLFHDISFCNLFEVSQKPPQSWKILWVTGLYLQLGSEKITQCFFSMFFSFIFPGTGYVWLTERGVPFCFVGTVHLNHHDKKSSNEFKPHTLSYPDKMKGFWFMLVLMAVAKTERIFSGWVCHLKPAVMLVLAVISNSGKFYHILLQFF